jgi:8-oxo-dGTP diphosphatase
MSMYVAKELVLEMERKYGVPRHLSMTFEISESEFTMLRGSRKHGRNHDITMFIFGDHSCRELAVIAKPMFPPGAYRPPSGAANPGESIEEGAHREAMEETGLEIELDRFILLIHVLFTCGDESENWRSFIFTAFHKGGTIGQHDFEEISETRWASIDELQGKIREILLETGMGLFAYRVALHDASIEEIRKLKLCGEPEVGRPGKS